MGILKNRIHESMLTRLSKAQDQLHKDEEILARTDEVVIDKSIIKLSIKNVYECDVDILYKDGRYIIDGCIICTGKYMDLSKYVLDGTIKITKANAGIIDCLPDSITDKSIILFYLCEWMTDSILSMLRSKYKNDKIISISKGGINDYLLNKFPSLSIAYLYLIKDEINNISFVTDNNGKSIFKRISINYKSNDILDFVYINESVKCVYFDIDADASDNTYVIIETLLNFFGDKLRIRMAEGNVRFIQEPSEKTIIGLPLKMKTNKYIAIKTPTDENTNNLLREYIEEHDPKKGDGTNRYFSVVLI